MHECSGRCGRQTSNDPLRLRVAWTVEMRLPINIPLNFEAECHCVVMWQINGTHETLPVRSSCRMRCDKSGTEEWNVLVFFFFIYSKQNSQVFETHSIRSSFSHLKLPICYSSLLVTRTMCKWNSDAQDNILFRSRKNNMFSGTLSHSVLYKILRVNQISRSAYEMCNTCFLFTLFVRPEASAVMQ